MLAGGFLHDDSPTQAMWRAASLRGGIQALEQALDIPTRDEEEKKSE